MTVPEWQGMGSDCDIPYNSGSYAREEKRI
jgi:hypothetical protein